MRSLTRGLPLVLLLAIGCNPKEPTQTVASATSQEKTKWVDPEPPPKKKAPTPAAGVGQSARLENMRVKLEGVKLERGEVRDQISGTKIKSTEELVIVELSVENLSTSKKVEFDTWDSDFGIRDAATLVDEFENTYRRVGFGFTAKLVGHLESESLYPGKSTRGVIAFQAPVGKATTLRLALPGRNCDVQGTFTFEFPTAPLRVAAAKPKRGEAEPVPREKPEPPPPSAKPKDFDWGMEVEQRKTLFKRIATLPATVEAAAIAKFGSKPKAGDSVTVKARFETFITNETNKAKDSLVKEFQTSREAIDAIAKEGEAKNWPKK